jgi:hypothetical protein
MTTCAKECRPSRVFTTLLVDKALTCTTNAGEQGKHDAVKKTKTMQHDARLPSSSVKNEDTWLLPVAWTMNELVRGPAADNEIGSCPPTSCVESIGTKGLSSIIPRTLAAWNVSGVCTDRSGMHTSGTPSNRIKKTHGFHPGFRQG